MHKTILITLSGRNRPEVLTTVTAVLARYSVRILDIEQSLIHDILSLSIIVEAQHEYGAEPLARELKRLCAMHCDMKIEMAFYPVSAQVHKEWLVQQEQPRSLITLLAVEITGKQLSRVFTAIKENGLVMERMTRLSGRTALKNNGDTPRACVECVVRGIPENIAQLRAQFMEISRLLAVDIAFQQDSMYRRTRRLLAFDMDSTLIQTEVIDELARRAGVFDQVSSITQAAMAGEMDFSTSLTERVALLRGLDEAVLAEIAGKLPLTQGAQRLISTVKKLGYTVVIISGGFTYFARHLQQSLGIDKVYANELEIEKGKLTGRVTGTIIDAQGKAGILYQLAEEQGIHLQQTVAVGDGANDLPMLDLAGLGIAFHAKALVRARSKQSISTLGLDSILYLLGLRDSDIAGC